jgi:hypothetical protein
MRQAQLDLFDERPTPKGDRFGHLFDVEVDGYMWRAVYRDPGLDPAERMTLYRGLISPDGTYYPVSGCHLVRLPYTDNLEDAVRNIRIGEAWINAGKTEYNSVQIEDCLEPWDEIPESCRDCRYAEQPKESHPCMICEWTDGKPSEYEDLV